MSNFCTKCGSKLDNNARFCDKCGKKIDDEDWKHKSGTRKKNGCLIAAILFLLIPTLVIFIGIKMAPESAKVPKNISIVMYSTKSNKEQSSQINSIFEQCDIKNVTEIKHDDALDNNYGSNETGYRIKTDSVGNIILYLREDKTVYCIRWADNIIYDNNVVVSKLSDYVLTLNEQTNLQIYSEKMVKDFLKAPSTADFPNIKDWKFHKDKEKIVIQSYVDSQNSFGAMLRSEFQIKLTPDGKTATSLIIDGKEYTNK